MPDFIAQLIANDILWVSVIASTLAQFLKPFTYKLRGYEFNWRYMAATGGMPSSHSAMVTALATGIGLVHGFNSAPFTIATVFALVVTYDAAGIRREAGEHGRAINLIVAELLSGHPMEEVEYKEVLGHSRTEVFGGILFGIVLMLLWKLVLQPLLI